MRRGQERGQPLGHGDRARAGSAAAVRAAEGLVRVEVHHVGAEIARPRDAQDGVHVGPVEIDQPAGVVDHLGDLLDPRLELPERVRVGNHEHGRLVVELGGQIVNIDEPFGRALDGDDLEAGHGGAGGIGAVGGVGDQHGGAFFAPIAEIGGGHEHGGHFAVRPGGRLERDGRQPGDLGQIMLRHVQQGEHPLEGRFRLIGVQIGHARQGRQPLVPLGVVLHRTGAQRIEVGIDRHVPGREVDEMSDDLRFREFRQRQRRVAQGLGRQQRAHRFRRHVARRQSAPRSSRVWRVQTGVGWIGCCA